jgi:mRNA interferase HicA
MKRIDLVRHLESQGCQLMREGREHSLYINRQTRKSAAVPRHLNIVRVQDVGLTGVVDPDILAWDRATLPDYAYERLAASEKLPGVFILNDRFPVGDATRRYC